jgi:hypothetical protein
MKWQMLAALIPLPLGLIAFKFYCKNAFDNSLKYYTQGVSKKGVEAPTPIDKESRRRDRVAVRFGYVFFLFTGISASGLQLVPCQFF